MKIIRLYFISIFIFYFNNANACTGTDVLVDVDNIKCYGGNDGQIRLLTTHISDNLPYTYSLNGGAYTSSNTFTGLTAGQYSLKVMNSIGCEYFLPDLIEITQPSPLTAQLNHTPIICGDDAKVFAEVNGGVGPYIFEWNGDPNNNVDTLRKVGSGSYSVKVIDQNQCSVIDELSILPSPVFDVNIHASNTLISIGEEVELSAVVNNPSSDISYQWYPNDDMVCSTCEETLAKYFVDTWVRVVVHDLQNGCVASDSIFIDVEGSFSIYIPNAFSPNGDRRNEFFKVFGVGLEQAVLKIYDKNGFLLYDGEGLLTGWDGTVSGQPQNEGLYFYQATITFLDGSISERKGQISLIR